MNPTIDTPMYKLLWAAVKTFVFNARVRYAKRALDRAFRRAKGMCDSKHESPDFYLEINGTFYTCTHSQEVSNALNATIHATIAAVKAMKQEATNG